MLNVVLLTMSPTHSTAELSRYQNTLDDERLSSKKENSLYDDKRLRFRIALPISNGQSSHDIRPSNNDDTSSSIDDDNIELSGNEMIIQKHRRDRITVTNSDRSKFNFNDDSLMLETPMPSLITDDEEIVISSKDWNDQDDDRSNNDENSDESSITIPLSPFEIQFHPMKNILSSRSLELFNDESNILLKQLVTSGTDEEKDDISFSIDVISQTLTSPDDNDNNNRRRYHRRHLVFLQPPSSSSQQHKNSQRIINGRVRRRLNDDLTLSITLNNTGIITSRSSSSNSNNGDERQRFKGGVFAATTHSNNNATLSSSTSSIPTVDDLNSLIQSFFENDVQLATLRDRLQLLEPESFELLDSIEFKGFVTTTSSTPETTSDSDDVKIVMTGATSPTDEDNSNDGGFPMMIVIIGVGVGCVVLIIGVVLWSFNKKKRNHRSSSNSIRRVKSRRLSEEERRKTNTSIDITNSNSGSGNGETLSCNSSNEHEMESMHSSHPQDNNNYHHHMLTNADNDDDDDEDLNPQEVLTMLQKRLSNRYAIYLGGTTPGPEDERYLRIITRLPITAVAPYPNVAKWAFELSTYAFECEKSGKRECDFFAGNGGLPAGESRDDTVDRRAKGVGHNHTRQRWNSPPSTIGGSSNSISEEERKRAEDLERKKLLRRLERWRKNEHVYLHREAMRRSLLDEDKPPQPILLRPMNANTGRQDVDDMANEAYHKTLFQNKQNLKQSAASGANSKRNNACTTTALQLRSRRGQDEWDKCMLLTGAATTSSVTNGGNGSHGKQHQQQQQQMEAFKMPFFFQCKE